MMVMVMVIHRHATGGVSWNKKLQLSQNPNRNAPFPLPPFPALPVP